MKIAYNANRFGYLNRFESIAFTGANGKSYDDIIVKVPHPDENNGKYVVNTDSPVYNEFLEDFSKYTKKFGLNYDGSDEYSLELDKYYDAVDKEIKADLTQKLILLLLLVYTKDFLKLEKTKDYLEMIPTLHYRQ